MNTEKTFTTETLQHFWKYICTTIKRLVRIQNTEPDDDFTNLWVDTSEEYADINSIVMRADAIRYQPFTIQSNDWGYEYPINDTLNNYPGMYCHKISMPGISENSAVINFIVDNDSYNAYSSAINWETKPNYVFLYTSVKPTGTINGNLVTAEVNGSGSLEEYKGFDTSNITAESIGALGINDTAKNSLNLDGKTYTTLRNEFFDYVFNNLDIHYHTMYLKLEPTTWSTDSKGFYISTMTMPRTSVVENSNILFTASANHNLLIDCDIHNLELSTPESVVEALNNYNLLTNIEIITANNNMTVTIRAFNEQPSGPIYLKVRKAVLANESIE